MKLQKLYSYVRRALDDYQMIQENDKIAVGISGGKDSLALLYALAGIRKFYPRKFDILAITVDLGFPHMDFSPVRKLCEDLHVEYHIVHTQIAQIVFQSRQDASCCSLCAKMRKGALVDYAKQLNCTGIAYAHHMDDVIETAFMSMLYEGRFYCFPPVTYFEDRQMNIIRPLIYVSEAEILGFKNKYQLPVVKNECPADGNTKREYVKQRLRDIQRDYCDAKKHIFHAVINGNIEGWSKYNGKESSIL